MQTYTKMDKESFRNFIKFQIDLGLEFYSFDEKDNAVIDIDSFNAIKTINELDDFVKKYFNYDNNFFISHNQNLNAKVAIIADNLDITAETNFPFFGQSLTVFENMFAAINLSKSNMFVLNFSMYDQRKNYFLKKNYFANPHLIISKYLEIISPKFLVNMCINTKIDFKLNIWKKDLQSIDVINPTILINQTELKRKAWEKLKKLREMINDN